MIKNIVYILFLILFSFKLLFSQAPDSCKNQYSNRNNLGIYGGNCNDLHFSSTNRLFAATTSPTSLYISDDSASTWYSAFPYDSLEFECGIRGWGGKGIRILSNQQNWIGVHTYQEGGAIVNAAVISFNNGDTGSWKTAMDGFMLSQYGKTDKDVTAIGLSEYFFYACLGPYICLIDSGSFSPSTDIIDSRSYFTSTPPETKVLSIAPINSTIGYPLYAIIDTIGDINNQYGSLFIFDGYSMSSITIPDSLSVTEVFTYPNANTKDTLLITGYSFSGFAKIYQSFDGGGSWIDISSISLLNKVEYQSSWKIFNTHGIVLFTNDGYSLDLGYNWMFGPNSNVAMLPTDTSYFWSSSQKGVLISLTGFFGAYHLNDNINLEAIEVYQISRSANKDVFYVATNAGLAYTTAYKDTNIISYNKWQSPYGKFPVIFNGKEEEITAVEVNLTDTSHVIAGYKGGLYFTKSGINGFQPSNLSGISNNDRIKDIVFVSNNIILAVSNYSDYGSAYGDIWRSTDGGINWLKVSPQNFGHANSLAVGYGSTDTVIYAATGYLQLDSGKLWKSSDLGLSWTKINDGPDKQFDASVSKMPIYDICVDPRGNDTIYLVASGGSNNASEFVQSTDGGISYHYLTINSMAGKATSITINQSHPDSVYYAFGPEILIYDFTNDTSASYFRGLPGEEIPDLSYGSILVGTTTGFYSVLFDDYDDVVTVNENKNFKNSQNISLYPNPFSNYIQIPQTNEDAIRLEIFNLYGEKITEITNCSSSIVSLPNFKKGYYLFRFTTPSNYYFAKAIKE